MENDPPNLYSYRLAEKGKEFEKNMYNAGAYKIKAAEESGFRLSSSG